jgi:protoporphyrinogen oxidase
MEIAIIGTGISGLSLAKETKKKHNITLFEKEESIGGLIKCKNVDGNLYHMVGGHVFNSKNKRVLDWFFNVFDSNKDFNKAIRNAKISFNSFGVIGYPIENFLYQLPETIVDQIIKDLLKDDIHNEATNFKDFLISKFGITLYETYFKPYNEKIWQSKLDKIPLEWLEGKLPMPNKKDIFLDNIFRKNEQNMVHSSFLYPKKGGSQFIVDKLAEKQNIIHENVYSIKFSNNKVIVNDEYLFDKLIFTGNIKDAIENKVFKLDGFDFDYSDFPFNSTTNALCSGGIDNDYSWVYLPDKEIKAHRIIMTGNFSKNNSKNEKSFVVEFSGLYDKEFVTSEIKKINKNIRVLDYNIAKYSYVLHSENTKSKVLKIKTFLKDKNIFLLGRFAEWEYYNMDTAILAALKLSDEEF